jgi:hypothetical protein
MLSKNKSYELSSYDLRKYPDFENISEEEAKQTIEQLKDLSLILYDSFQNHQRKTNQIESFKINDHDEE